MKASVISVVVLGMIALALLAGGCATSQHWYSGTCAWCKQTCADTQTTGTSPMTKKRYQTWKQGKYFEEGGHRFCSLRCINAYNASTGIKEQRQRVIFGE